LIQTNNRRFAPVLSRRRARQKTNATKRDFFLEALSKS